MDVYKDCCKPARVYCDNTEDKHETLADYKGLDNSIWPTTLFGDWIIDQRIYQPGCMVKFGNYVCMIADRLKDYADNTGHMWVFDCLRDDDSTHGHNRLLFETDLEVGHANSCCYNPKTKMLYVVASWDWEKNTNSNVIYRYKFNSTMTGIEAVEPIKWATHFPYGISYDYVTGKMYCFGGGYSGLLKCYNYVYAEIYDSEESTIFTDFPFFQIPLSEFPGQVDGDRSYTVRNDYGQDVAIRDNKIFMVGRYGACLVFDLLTQEIYAKKTVANMSLENWKLGEVEGSEFDENGTLFTCRYCNLISAPQSDEIPCDMMATIVHYDHLVERPIIAFQAGHPRVALTDGSVSRFRNWRAEIKHPMQVNAIFSDTTQLILWNTNKYFKKTEFNVPVMIEAYNVNCASLRFRVGKNMLYGSAYNTHLHFTNPTQHIVAVDNATIDIDAPGGEDPYSFIATTPNNDIRILVSAHNTTLLCARFYTSDAHSTYLPIYIDDNLVGTYPSEYYGLYMAFHKYYSYI